MAAEPQYAATLSYLGTYADDRQPALDRLFIEAARVRPDERFVIGGAQYPDTFPWTPNIFFVRHLPPASHPAFFCSSPITLNITRRAFAELGHCPSGRLFEAAACGAAVVSDWWGGLDEFFTPGDEILVARDTTDVLAAIDLPREELARIGRAARQRTLAEHTADHRAIELEGILEDVLQPERIQHTRAPLVHSDASTPARQLEA
jgi:spore maturation protein CgeB